MPIVPRFGTLSTVVFVTRAYRLGCGTLHSVIFGEATALPAGKHPGEKPHEHDQSVHRPLSCQNSRCTRIYLSESLLNTKGGTGSPVTAGSLQGVRWA